jgi:hypothetical protein
VTATTLGFLTFTASAAANHATRPHTDNMEAKGHSFDFGSFLLPDGQRDVNSDLAFWGNLVFHGDYDGFRIVTRDPGDPTLISRTRCNGDQGDIVVWEDILVRSWNTKRADPRNCDGATVAPGFEGVHIFDISDVEDPVLVGELRLPCGSHTVSVAGVSGGNLIVYSNNSSGAGCDGGPANGDFMDVIAVPLANPGAASLIHREPLAGPTNPAVTPGCHDAGVIRGDVNLAVCASADTTNVFSIGAPGGGTLSDPRFLYTIQEPGVDGLQGRWHSAAVRRRELHDPQLQHRAVAQRPLRGRRRSLPGGDVGHRVHQPGCAGDTRVVRPAAGGADAARWRLELVLVRQLHLRVRDPGRPERLPRQRT